MSIKFGPAGVGGVNEAIYNLEKYKSLGLESCEIAFTYGIYIKKKEDALKIGEASKKLGIDLSIHAPYWINLNSTDKEKINKSKERILKCLEVGTWLRVKKVVFHPGYYGKKDKEETYQNIKREILEIQEKAKKEGYTPKLAPETTGKVNVFGGIEEIYRLVKETGCSFCIDFAHILARYKDYEFKTVIEKFKDSKDWHIHFSGIDYCDKGEKKHIKTKEKDLRILLKNLPKNKSITIINESPTPVEDSVLGDRILRKKQD